MMDIKIKKVNTNNRIEKVTEKEDIPASNFSKISIFLFGFMIVSVVSYVSLVSSSIFYAVKTSQYAYKTQNISTLNNTQESYGELDINENSSRISYINKDSDTSISLK